jgi:hypothetical protein
MTFVLIKGLAKHTYPLDRVLLFDVGYVHPPICISLPGIQWPFIQYDQTIRRLKDCTKLTFSQHSNRLRFPVASPHRAQES